MAKKVSVPVLWNINSYLGGALMNIDVQSKYVATVSKPSAPYQPAFPTPPGFFIPTLQIEDPNFGVLYLNMTLVAYQNLIRGASVSPETSLLITSDVNGSSLTNPFFGVPLLTITTQGQAYINGTDFTQNIDTETITWTNGNTFSIGQTLVAAQ